MYSYINSVNIFCQTSSEAGLPAAIRILPRSAHCCMVLLRPSILAFSSWCCLIIPSRAVRSLRNTDHFFLVTLTPSQNILKKESWQFYFLNSCLTAILVSLFSSISDVIVLAAIVCKSVKEQKIAKGPHVPAMYMNDSHTNQWLTNIMSAYYNNIYNTNKFRKTSDPDGGTQYCQALSHQPSFITWTSVKTFLPCPRHSLWIEWKHLGVKVNIKKTSRLHEEEEEEEEKE